MNTQTTSTKEPGVTLTLNCKSTYTDPVQGDRVELTAAGEVARIADNATTLKFVGEVVAVSPDLKKVSVETPYGKFVPVLANVAITTVGLGMWVGQKVRRVVESGAPDDSILVAAQRGMMIFSTATAEDETVYVAY